MGKILGKLNILPKQILIVALSSVFFIILAAFSFTGLQTQRDILKDILERRFSLFESGVMLQSNILEINERLNSIIIDNLKGTRSGDFIKMRDEIQTQIDESRKILSSVLELATLTDEERDFFQAINGDFDNYEKSILTAMQFSTNIVMFSTFVSGGRQAAEEMKAQVKELREYEETRIKSSYDQATGNYNRIIRMFLIIIALSLVITLVFSLSISFSITGPIKKLVEYSQHLAAGDFLHSLDLERTDEIGKLKESLDNIKGSLRTILERIRGTVDLTAATNRTIIGDIDDSTKHLEHLRSTITSTRDTTVLLNTEVENASGNIHEVKNFVSQDLDHIIGRQNDAVQSASSPIEQIEASIRNIYKMVETEIRTVEDLTANARNGMDMMSETIVDISTVSKSTTVILELIEVIRGIASQTNLLAMNAAIEAAHAGESGKGFAVVADEIRKLAEDTSRNSSEMSKSLEEVMDHIIISEEKTGRTGAVFQNIVQAVNSVNESMLTLQNSMKELSSGSRQIVSLLSEIIETSRDVKESAGVMNSRVDSISGAIGTISEKSARTKESMEENTEKIGELFDRMKHIVEISVSHTQSMESLKQLMSGFNI